MKILRISRPRCRELKIKGVRDIEELKDKYPDTVVHQRRSVIVKHKQPKGILNLGCGVEIILATDDKGVLYVDYLKSGTTEKIASLSIPVKPGIWRCFYKIAGIRLKDMDARLYSNVVVVILRYRTGKVKIPL